MVAATWFLWTLCVYGLAGKMRNCHLAFFYFFDTNYPRLDFLGNIRCLLVTKTSQKRRIKAALSIDRS